MMCNHEKARLRNKANECLYNGTIIIEILCKGNAAWSRSGSAPNGKLGKDHRRLETIDVFDNGFAAG
jgi:hypothetical protein